MSGSWNPSGGTVGLIQRRNTSTSSTAQSQGDADRRLADDECKSGDVGAAAAAAAAEDGETDDGNGKEIRLTLMEEVLLLGLKDKEVALAISICIHLAMHRINCQADL